MSIYTVDALLYLEYALLELRVLSFPLYRDFFHCSLAFSVAFLFLFVFTASAEMFWNTYGGSTENACFQAFGPQSAPSLHLKPAPAQRAGHDPP